MHGHAGSVNSFLILFQMSKDWAQGRADILLALAVAI